MRFGSILLQKLGIGRKNDISQRMRQIGRMKDILCGGDDTKQLFDYLTATCLEKEKREKVLGLANKEIVGEMRMRPSRII